MGVNLSSHFAMRRSGVRFPSGRGNRDFLAFLDNRAGRVFQNSSSRPMRLLSVCIAATACDRGTWLGTCCFSRGSMTRPRFTGPAERAGHRLQRAPSFRSMADAWGRHALHPRDWAAVRDWHCRGKLRGRRAAAAATTRTPEPSRNDDRLIQSETAYRTICRLSFNPDRFSRLFDSNESKTQRDAEGGRTP